MTPIMPNPASQHRIGAVSALSGVPVSTLRVWETRHSAFAPAKSEGRHRLYSDEDVLRASLIKQLTEAGHSISTLAQRSVTELNDLLGQQRIAHRQQRPAPVPQATVTLAVVGFGDGPYAADTVPGLTSVRVNGSEIGSLAARHLIQRAEGEVVDPRIVDIGFSIIERDMPHC